MTPWDINHVTLRNRWPRIASAIAAAPIDECAMSTWGTTPALVYRGRQMTSAYDPLDEAKRQADGLPLDAEAVYCYGVGLGHLPAVLAVRHRHTCVVVMNLSVARAAMESAEQRWLTAPHVSMVLAGDVDILYAPYACSPMECRYADDQGHATRDRLFAHLNSRFVNDFHFGVNAPQDAKHVEANEAHVSVDTHVSALFGSAKGSRAVLVGGGPSLMGEYDWLRSAQSEGAIVIATTTVLSVLLERGICPDISVLVDTDPVSARQIQGVDMERTAAAKLLYHPTVAPPVVAAWRGPRYFYHSPRELYTSGTVMHTCADLAVKMGVIEITMLGMDFCYPGAKSHADGTALAEGISQRATLFETVDGNGQRAYTDPNLAHYHRHLEDYINQVGGGVQWFKRGRSGVSVRGAEWV